MSDPISSDGCLHPGEAEYRRLVEKAMNEFLATLAHELRNPLAPIRNAVQLLQLKGSHLPDMQWALGVIDRQMQQMTRLIDDLLDVARITGNKLAIRKERIELSEIISAAVEIGRPWIESSGHGFVVSLPPKPVYLEGDLTRLSQVVANLLNNAAKYTEPGGKIWLTAERQGSDAVISVRDSGVGIPAEMLPHVFDMFTQADRSLERSRGGLGVGLTLVKKLVELHGGTVTAQSKGPGLGSEFIVRLPVALEVTSAPTADRDTTTSRSALRILVVDDNRDSVSSLGMLLRITGNDVRTAYDGLQALEVAEEFRPQVVLLDIGLPKLNGYETARRLRQQPWSEGTVLIALTGWGQDADKERSKEAGFDHHLVKPVNPAVLSNLLTSLDKAVCS